MAQKLAARNALTTLKDKETVEAKEKDSEDANKKHGSQTLIIYTLYIICNKITIFILSWAYGNEMLRCFMYICLFLFQDNF